MPGGRARPEGPPPEVLARFTGARVARMARITADGPRLRRLDDLAADPRVALLADHYAKDWAEPPPGPVVAVTPRRWAWWSAT